MLEYGGGFVMNLDGEEKEKIVEEGKERKDRKERK